jgi:Bacterial Ig-like domain (group 3)/S-layer homology domain
VTFLDGSSTFATSPLDGTGHASAATSSLTAGTHSVTARYSGDTEFAPSTSGAVSQTVQRLFPMALAADSTASGLSDGNGVLDPGETVSLVPSWTNVSGGAITAAGVLSSFGGPAGATYDIVDSSSRYGSIAPGTTADCAGAGDCYSIRVSLAGPRPSTHWDASARETMSTGETKVWTLHVGGSFADVPASNLFYRPIETLLHNGITVGCTATDYCPTNDVTRGQIAIFIARAELLGMPVPASGMVGGSPYSCVAGGVSLFTDVPPSDPACAAIHYVASQGISDTCGGGAYCPAVAMTRGVMSMFVARAVAGGDASVPVSYADPESGRQYSCDAAAPNLHFTDVAATDADCRHIHYLWARQILDGFGDGTFRPDDDVTREQMSKFLGKAFRLELYGPWEGRRRPTSGD